MKPIPETTCAAMRDTSKRILGSFKTPSKPKAETIMNKAEPKATKKWVRRPAAFSRYSRSKPMKPPKSAATKMRMINSNVSIILSFTIVVANLHKKKEACNLSRYKFNLPQKHISTPIHYLHHAIQTIPTQRCYVCIHGLRGN